MNLSNTQLRLASALALAAFCLLPGAAAAEPVGFLAVTEGDVEIRSGGAASWSAATRDSEIELGDVVRTGRDSLAKLVLVDDTVITLDEETELEVDELVVGSAATRQASRVNLLSGHVRTRVGQAFGGTTRLEMHTPTAVIGVKGTEWVAWVLDDVGEIYTFICVLAGEVDVASNDPNVSGVYEPAIGTCTKILPKASPEPAEIRPDLTPVGQPRSRVASTTTTVVSSSTALLPGVGTGPVGPDINVDIDPDIVIDDPGEFVPGNDMMDPPMMDPPMMDPPMDPPPMDPTPTLPGVGTGPVDPVLPGVGTGTVTPQD